MVIIPSVKKATLNQSVFNDIIRKGSKIVFIGEFYPKGVQIFQKFMPCTVAMRPGRKHDSTCSNCKGKLKLVGFHNLICGRNAINPNVMNLIIVSNNSILEDDLFDI